MQKFSRQKKAPLWFIIGIILTVLLISFALYFGGSEGSSESTKRVNYSINNIGEIKLALELYYSAHQSFPKTGGQCIAVETVSPQLIEAGFQKSFTTQLALGYPIKLSVSSDALHYVLESEGSGFKDSSVLTTDIDGQILGCNCDDPNYCVTN